KKKIVISEDAIREILQLNDAEGVVCFPNDEIFAGLAQMGYEKPSTKLRFYKAFFSKEIDDDVAQPTLPLPSSLIVPPSPPYQSPRASPSQAAEGTSILVQHVIPAAEPVVVAVSTPVSAAKPKVLKVVHVASTVSTRKRKGVVIRDPEEELNDDTPAETQSSKDKGKEEEDIIKSINETPA
nr:hypothetical protein [Tanacetum cinerariifolium]